MYSLPVPLLLPVEHSILVLRHHHLLRRHLGLPPLHGWQRLALLGERLVERRDHAVNVPQAQPMSALLELRQAEGDLPKETPAKRICESEGSEHGGCVSRMSRPLVTLSEKEE